MIYFIPWALFLVSIILAVPVASWLEKRKYAIPKDKSIVDGPDDEVVATDDVVMEAEAEPAEVQFDSPGGDDFSAFEDDFK